MTADLKTDQGREFLESLIRVADVLVENFRPGVLDRLGFSKTRLRELNSELILCSLTGFGHDGPESQRAGYDQIAQGEAGLMSITGPRGEPTKVGVPIGDLLTGMNGAFGIVAALFERERTGHARIVRTSLLASIVGVHAYHGTRYTVAGQVPLGEGNHHPSIAPYGLFESADSPLQIACGNESLWRRLCDAVGIDAAESDYLTNSDRVAHRVQLTVLLNDKLREAPSAHWLKLFEQEGIPAGLVRTLDEVYKWDQTRSRAGGDPVERRRRGRRHG